MNNLNFTPHDLLQLKQYKKYASALGYTADIQQWRYSAINRMALQNISQCKSITNPTVVLYIITNAAGSAIYNTAMVSQSIEYICPCGSIFSNNGDYRSGLINYKSFTSFLDKNKSVNTLLQNIIMYVTDTFALNTSKFTRKYFYSKTQSLQSTINIENTCDKMYVYFFTLTWIKFYYEYKTNTLCNNLNNEFKTIMLLYKKHNSTFTKFITGFKKEFEILIYICYNNASDKINLYESKKLGQKLTMLNVAEMQCTNNIIYSVWRELAINNKIRTLISSKTSNGFAFCNRSLIVYADCIADLFDNPSHFDKINKSVLAVQVEKLLIQARNILQPMKTSFHKKVNKIIQSITYDHNYKNTNSNLDILHNDINFVIDFSKENIILSHNVLNMISEYSGLTFYDITIKQNTMFLKNNFSTFNKYMFQLLYNLYCLHDKIHCIHGDLHLNNITISPLFNAMPVVNIANPQIVYIIDQHYAFVNNFHNLCIIDFNNSIINPDLYKNANKDKLLQTQIDNLTSYLFSVKPNYKTYAVTIKNNMLYHFYEYFKLLSALDIYNISSKLLTFMEKRKSNEQIYKNTKALVVNMQSSADYYLTVKFAQLLDATDYTEFTNMPWPAFIIIQKLFANNTTVVASCVTDIYAYSNFNN